MTEKQASQPKILLIEQDDETRPLLIENLRNKGYRVIVTLEEEDAIERARGNGRGYPDLILLNQVGQSIEVFLEIGQRIRQRAGLPNRTPIVVVADRFEADMEGKDIQVGESEYVSYPEDGQQLLNLLRRLA